MLKSSGTFSEGCGFEPRYGQRVVSLSKALNHYYSSLPRCINGYRQCWEGKQARCGGGVASPTQRKMSLAQFASRGRWAPRPVFTG